MPSVRFASLRAYFFPASDPGFFLRYAEKAVTFVVRTWEERGQKRGGHSMEVKKNRDHNLEVKNKDHYLEVKKTRSSGHFIT